MAGLVVSAGIVLPLFTWFEPRDTRETIARTLIVLAAIGGGLIAWSAGEAAAAWRGTAKLRRRWTQEGRPIEVGETRLPVFAVDEAFPIVGVVGIRRPALFVAERVLTACTPGEIAAIFAHEHAHVAARDNLWRLVLRAAPALLPRAAGAGMDRAWDDAAERFDLASALIRISRLVPERACAPAGVSAFHDGGPIESRVRRLLEPPTERTIAAPFVAVSALTAAAVVVIALARLAPRLHDAIESIVSLP